MSTNVKKCKKNPTVTLYLTEKQIQDYGLDISKLEQCESGKRWKYDIPVTEDVYEAYNREYWRIKRKGNRDKKKFVIFSLERQSDEYQDDLQQIIDVEATVMRRLQIEAIYAIIRLMEPLNQRIILMYLQGYTESEIGEVIGVSQKAVNKRKQRIYEFIRQNLQEK